MKGQTSIVIQAPVSYWEILLTAQNGNTHVTQRFHYMPQNRLARMMTNDKLAQQIREECDINFARLKGILEEGRG